MLGMLSYTFLNRRKFRTAVDYGIYLTNAIGFAGIICMYSLFMYYDQLSAEVSSMIGFIISIFILMLMLAKIVFFAVKLVRDFKSWK